MSLLETKGDYQFANALNKNLKELAEAIRDAGKLQEIEIPMTGGYTLVAGQNSDPAYYAEELYITVRHPDGTETDLVCVSQKYHYDKAGSKVMEPGKFRIFLADGDGEYRKDPFEVDLTEKNEKD